MPKDRITQAHQGYGFVEFIGEEDADYAIKIMNMIKLFGKPIRVNKVRGLICALPIFFNLHMIYCCGRFDIMEFMLLQSGKFLRRILQFEMDCLCVHLF